MCAFASDRYHVRVWAVPRCLCTAEIVLQNENANVGNEGNN